MVFTSDLNNVVGRVGGKKTTKGDDLNKLIINGEAKDIDFNTPNISGEVGEGTRDRIYKHGTINGDIIDWEVVIGGDELGVNPNTMVTDEIGEGHSLIKDSLKFYIIENGQYNDRLVDMVIRDVETNPQEINFYIDQLAPCEVLLFTYKTKIIDESVGRYSNMIIVEDERKIAESVEIEGWEDVTGDKPEKPIDPPTKPELPEKLPQVGEAIFKIEYLIGSIFIAAGMFLRKRL